MSDTRHPLRAISFGRVRYICADCGTVCLRDRAAVVGQTDACHACGTVADFRGYDQ